MSLSTQELKLRVEAKMNELKAQLKSFAADGAGEAREKKAELESHLKNAEVQIKDGWDKITDQAASKLNEWLKKS